MDMHQKRLMLNHVKASFDVIRRAAAAPDCFMDRLPDSPSEFAIKYRRMYVVAYGDGLVATRSGFERPLARRHGRGRICVALQGASLRALYRRIREAKQRLCRWTVTPRLARGLQQVQVVLSVCRREVEEGWPGRAVSLRYRVARRNGDTTDRSGGWSNWIPGAASCPPPPMVLAGWLP